MRFKVKKIYVIFACIIALVVLGRFTGIGSYLNLAFFSQHKIAIKEYINSFYGLSVCAFIALYIGVILAMLPLTLILNVIAGYLFGTLPALLYTVFSATVGSVLYFFVVRYGMKDIFMNRFGSRLVRFKAEFDRWGFYYLLFLQLFPLTPFGLIIILAALSDISWFAFASATSLGIIPGTLVYVMAGNTMHEATSMQDIMTWQMGVILSLLAFVAVLPLIFKRVFGCKTVEDV